MGVLRRSYRMGTVALVFLTILLGLLWLAAHQGLGHVTPANAARIRAGMTRAEVDRILGADHFRGRQPLLPVGPGEGEPYIALYGEVAGRVETGQCAVYFGRDGCVAYDGRWPDDEPWPLHVLHEGARRSPALDRVVRWLGL